MAFPSAIPAMEKANDILTIRSGGTKQVPWNVAAKIAHSLWVYKSSADRFALVLFQIRKECAAIVIGSIIARLTSASVVKGVNVVRFQQLTHPLINLPEIALVAHNKAAARQHLWQSNGSKLIHRHAKLHNARLANAGEDPPGYHGARVDMLRQIFAQILCHAQKSVFCRDIGGGLGKCAKQAVFATRIVYC